MEISNEKLKEIIARSDLVKPEDLSEAYKKAEEQKKDLGDILIEQGFISEEYLTKILAETMGVEYVDLSKIKILQDVLKLITEDMAENLRVVAFKKEGNILSLAMENPNDFETIDFIRKKTGYNIKPYLTSAGDLDEALGYYKADIQKDFDKIIQKNVEKSKIKPKEEFTEGIQKVAQEVPVVKIIDTILEYAIYQDASDVHIEKREDKTEIRFRIDGVLHDVIDLPKEIHEALVARTKILSRLKIDETRLPQDGRFKFNVGKKTYVSLRVSIIPSFYGEDVVLRILKESGRILTLGELGLEERNLEVVKAAIKKPYGMILVTGPTGSGKTTTLYSILNILNTPQVKICTIEDPIEYSIEGIQQTQVKPEIKLTFANGLRSFLRHDPDIMMVGEIRDHETAEIAVHSALTGHLMLSTLHTNDATSAIFRFIDLRAEPFLLASTLNIIMAQRLVRKICKNCIESYSPDPKIIKSLDIRVDENTKFYHGKGCNQCNNSGYKGRIGVYEVLKVTETISELINKGATLEKIKRQAVEDGMTFMKYDGIEKAKRGITTLEEVLRVTKV